MPSHRYFQLDVFTRSAGGGNPLGVVVAADDWSSEAMQRFAAWTGLVETTFLLQPGTPDADYRVRIFTPQREIAFAGHPSIGSAHTVLEARIAQPRAGLLVQESLAGLLPIRVEGERDTRQLSVQSPRSRVLSQGLDGQAALQGVLAGVELGALAPAFVEGGRRWWLAEFASEEALRAWQPDHHAIGHVARASDSLGLCVFARSASGEHDLCVRAFPAGVGIIEDPASGAANGLIGAYIAEQEPHGALAAGYTVSQGREIGHDARIVVRIDADGAVWVGGRTLTIVDGVTLWKSGYAA